MSTAATAGPARAGSLRSRWLPFPVDPDARIRLYCLPHAGGSASAFRSWTGRAGDAAVCPVQLPGRDARVSDPAHPTMPALVGDLAGVLLAEAAADPRPYALYGHSLGALVGFELARELRRRGGPQPEHLIVSGCSAPQAVEDPADDLSDAQIVSLLRSLGGTPELYLSDPRVLRLILPAIRADLTVRNSYRYRPEQPLTIPLTAIAATSDARAPAPSLAAWRDQTVGRFRLHTLVGGHFAVLEQPETTLRHLTAALRPV
ncbi:thioesterase II family protein [Streptomyces aidingensis]|uniref:Medium-chain acyl-[acyl-carrier-protein] hydrolase n=1 Tax=Streptomyces aidingensis TaxID=910347 RepID=A0A1I1MXX6_9ACTN|nr:alpha/beta fold hydrolase [Streptomyces aidingensis]SFC88088.1 medium-chain acyl-[acyl-carrier-protein] hydrolase [Streptomyces aidingensis]